MAFSKGGFGGSLGVVGVPFLAVAIPINQGSGGYADLFNHYGHFWHFWLEGFVVLASIGSSATRSRARCLFRAMSFHALSENALQVMIGLIGLVFAAQWWIKHLNIVDDSPAGQFLARGTRFWSMVAGFSALACTQGDRRYRLLYFLSDWSLRIRRDNGSLFSHSLILVKVFPYYWLDQFSSKVLWTALVLAPLCPLAVRLGILLNKRLSELWFYRVCYFGLVISSGRLLIIGMTNYSEL